MRCKLCLSSANLVFSQNSICMWTGGGELTANKLPVQLYQCSNCGHIFQSLEPIVLKEIEAIYESNNAQASTQLGDGNWGEKRAENFLKFSPNLPFSSLLEIGCGNGYILRHFSKQGVKLLVGIEPSLQESSSEKGIHFIKAYTNSSLELKQRFDMIFSSAVFEHIDDILDTFLFCANHLNEDGILYFSVPNSELDVHKNDPALFAHEHIHYFSRSSLKVLCQQSNLHIRSLSFENDSLYVQVQKKPNPSFSITCTHPNMPHYQAKLVTTITNTKSLFEQYSKILIHGATNSTHNILQWGDLTKQSFTLVDNDTTKHGNAFFEKTVQPFITLNPSDYDCIIIAPIAYFDDIKHDYIANGFTDNIHPLGELPL